MSNLLQQLNNELAAISERALESLVQVHNGQRGAGAGSIWHGDGLIVTNAHVVLQQSGRVAHALSVTLRDGRELPARVLAYDAEHDLAALRIDADGLPAVELGDSRRLQPGDLVLALGFPFGIRGGATSGVVIGAGAHLPELGDARREWIAASLHLRPGHSGGPMVDSRGRLVGINTLMTGPEVGVAVPVHVAVRFLKQALGRPSAPPPGVVTV
ncbi:MAG TPA: trypsin-like peptidase domain-containing protein [Caldilineaceae bacterium]|nr:trypsin-like peptidase domain-containing protein [Caldilineaceae bacterium]